MYKHGSQSAFLKNIFLKRGGATQESTMSSDLPAKLDSIANINLVDIPLPSQTAQILSATSPVNTENVTNLSSTSEDVPAAPISAVATVPQTMAMIESESGAPLSPDNPIQPIEENKKVEIRNDDLPVTVNVPGFNWKDATFYFAQIDMDIAWMDKIGGSNSLIFGNIAEFFSGSDKKPIPVVTDIRKAVKVGKKLCKFAEMVYDPSKRNVEYKSSQIFPNAIMSSTEQGKYSYPIYGSVVFCLKFMEEPTVADVGGINKDQYNMIKDKGDVDIVLYNANWSKYDSEKKRAVIFESGLSKLKVVEVSLHKFSCAIGEGKGSAILKILGTSSEESRFAQKYIDLLEKLNKENSVKIVDNQSGGAKHKRKRK